jgi:hypothetical protein
MTTITAEVGRLKQRLPNLISPALVEALVAKLPQAFRRRILTPVLVIQLLVLRVLECNTAYAHLPHLARVSFTPSAFCQALARLPLELLQALLTRVGTGVDENAPAAQDLFVGHRVLLADALCVSMPDTPALAAQYGYPSGQKPGLGFPLAKLLLLLDLSTGLIRRVLINPYRTHEFSQARNLHPELHAGDILVGDRGFCSFVHLALLLGQACHGLFRVHQRLAWNLWLTKNPRHAMQAQIVGMLGLDDRLMIYRKPKTCPTWMSAQDYAALPAQITVRELCYRVSPKGFRSRQVMLVTTLLDPVLYARKELARLYGLRWQIETQFRHLKCTLGMAILKGKTVAVIEREILAYVLVYNLVAREIRSAAARQKVPPDRVSFIDATRWLLAGMRPGVPLALNPLRPGRSEPRARKRRPLTYPFMTRTRKVMRKELARNAKKASALT